ncbi:MAG: DNA topoisomerase 3 [Myxococcota bacterium]
MRLVITEKPSVARDIARSLNIRGRRDGYFEGNDLRISWCIGHLVELQDPAHYRPEWKSWSMKTLPIIPDQFALRLRQGIDDQWKVLHRLLLDKNTADVVNACDAGREGELIFRYVYQLAGSQLPVMRLWVSSLTDQAIQAAWKQMRPGTRYDPLADAARCRSEADWLVGLNATRAMTCLARTAGGTQVLSVGRVQTPTLAMIVNRDHTIETFVPEPFWQIKATFTAMVHEKPVQWSAKWFRKPTPAERVQKLRPDEVPHAERVKTEADAQAIAQAALGQDGTVGTADRKQRRERPPLLYDLTSLQRRANRRYGFSAQRTLQIAQALYEKHKLISYPRTDARYITPDQVPMLPGVVNSLAKLPVYQPYCQAIVSKPIRPGKRVVNAAEVGDHHAILPTGRVPSARGLSREEKQVFDLIARRLLAALSDDALFDVTTLIVDVPPKAGVALPDGITAPIRFRARGRICTQEGWRAVDPPGKSRELELPAVQQGQTAHTKTVKPEKGETRPPARHSDASLLRAMETAGRDLDDAELKRAMRSSGLGTPATRAQIIQTLLKREYITRNGRELRSTDRGRGLIAAIPIDQLKSAEMTGAWEARLAAIADNREQRGDFMENIRRSVHEMVQALQQADPPAAVHTDSDLPVLGTCPLCTRPVRERPNVYTCDTGRDCDFVIFKSIARRKISVTTVKQLLKDGRSKPLKRFKSRSGKLFSAALRLNDAGKVEFDFNHTPQNETRTSNKHPTSAPKATKPSPTTPQPTPGPPPPPQRPVSKRLPKASTPVGMSCPRCRTGRLIRGRTAWGCNRWREGCRYVLPFNDQGGGQRSEADAVAIVERALHQDKAQTR